MHIRSAPSQVEAVDGLGRTALFYAVHFAQLDSIEILLENGCKVNAQAHGESLGLGSSWIILFRIKFLSIMCVFLLHLSIIEFALQ